jgi:hypothetical protein
MTPETFKRLRDTQDEELLSHVVCAEADDAFFSKGLRAVKASQLTVLCVETFFGEVCNGGLMQFIDNQSRIARFAPEALDTVGLLTYSPLLREALGRCTNSPEENDFGELQDVWECPDSEHHDGPFHDLDERFFELYFAEKAEFRHKLFAYLISHEAEFVASS